MYVYRVEAWVNNEYFGYIRIYRRYKDAVEFANKTHKRLSKEFTGSPGVSTHIDKFKVREVT